MCQASEHDTPLLRMLRQQEASQVRPCTHGRHVMACASAVEPTPISVLISYSDA